MTCGSACFFDAALPTQSACAHKFLGREKWGMWFGNDGSCYPLQLVMQGGVTTTNLSTPDTFTRLASSRNLGHGYRNDLS
jgi:hypothetical protein